jgi:hypothetical protein
VNLRQCDIDDGHAFFDAVGPGMDDGDVRATPYGMGAVALKASMSGKVGRNEPCPCGSGKKLKKCRFPCRRKE